jgi:hypothetical protein
MKFHVPWLNIGMFPGSKPEARHLRAGPITVAVVLSLCFALASQAEFSADKFKSNLYVPYEDLAELIEPQDKAILMDRAEFEQLLADARANAAAAPEKRLGQVTDAQYSATASQEQLELTGEPVFGRQARCLGL